MKGFSGFGNSTTKQNIKDVTEGVTENIIKLGKRGNILGLMFGATKTATADQPNFPKGSVHYRDPKKKIKFGK